MICLYIYFWCWYIYIFVCSEQRRVTQPLREVAKIIPNRGIPEQRQDPLLVSYIFDVYIQFLMNFRPTNDTVDEQERYFAVPRNLIYNGVQGVVELLVELGSALLVRGHLHEGAKTVSTCVFSADQVFVGDAFGAGEHDRKRNLDVFSIGSLTSALDK